ncbi:hypothetical protein K491DRAFT_720029 [Lophiostoma macrostomum CBS 122681]|uniref:Uncharacterized protein n=1 Tax=Lophiostoma macrostomum CBS 122681 TaxID=1314788 RepID=A0A6A6SXC4_9PLEO|nr:hypothetical protein K491DRAFT_720029 [Lophiostoma macrostomum CBS 122681]
MSVPELPDSTIKLLHLPAELFTPIITDVVREIGPAKAWRLRGVCKTFQSYIEDEVLRNTPVNEFTRRDNSIKIIHKNLERFLLQRCLFCPENLATNTLPLFLVDLADTILTDYPPQDPTQSLSEIRHSYISHLVRMVVEKDPNKTVSCPWASHACEWTNVSNMSGKANPTNYTIAARPSLPHLVVAAAAVGNAYALQSY